MTNKSKVAVIAAVVGAFLGGMVAAHAVPASPVDERKRTAIESTSDEALRVPKRGDLILEVGKTPVSTAGEFARLMQSGDPVALLVRRGASTFYMGLVLE